MLSAVGNVLWRRHFACILLFLNIVFAYITIHSGRTKTPTCDWKKCTRACTSTVLGVLKTSNKSYISYLQEFTLKCFSVIYVLYTDLIPILPLPIVFDRAKNADFLGLSDHVCALLRVNTPNGLCLCCPLQKQNLFFTYTTYFRSFQSYNTLIFQFKS